MKIETTPTENHEITLTIQVENEEFERAKRRAARKLARGIKIPGFRPGKAPYNVVVRHVGEAAVIEEAIDQLADELYPKALEEADITPGAAGILEEITEMDPLTLVFTVPLEPEVTLGDYKDLRLPYEYEAPSEEDVDEYLDALRQQQAVVTTVERPAQEGDIVHIVLNAEWLDAPEGEETAILKDRHVPVLIESEEADTTEEWPFPGFSRQVLGLSAGDEKEVAYEYEEEVASETFQGKNVRFHIKVEKVTEREVPEADDEFAQSLGDFDTIADLRATIHELLESQSRSEYDNDYNNRVLDALVEQSEIKFAPATLQRELNALREEFENSLQEQGLDLQTYLQFSQQSEEELEEELRKAAEARVRRTLTLFQFSREENVEAEEDEVQQSTMEFLTHLSQQMPEKEFRKMMQNPQSLQSLVGSVMADLINEKAIQALSKIAQGKGDEPEETEEEEADEETNAPEAEDTSEETPEVPPSDEGSETDTPQEAPTPEAGKTPEEETL